MTDPKGLADSIALLESRCAAIDLHYARFPMSLDRTMEDTAKAIRAALAALRQEPSVEEVEARKIITDIAASKITEDNPYLWRWCEQVLSRAQAIAAMFRREG